MGESLKEVVSLEELKQAVRVMVKVAHFGVPWNMSFSAIESFLFASNWCAATLSAHSNRVAVLANFINYVLAQNASNWLQKEPFLSTSEVKQAWEAWSATRVSITLTTPATAAPSTPQTKRPFWSARRPSNSSAGPSSSQPASPTTPATPNASPAAQPRIAPTCRRYNNGGRCPNPHANCVLPGGLKLAHLCDKNKANGTPCRGHHPGSQHR